MPVRCSCGSVTRSRRADGEESRQPLLPPSLWFPLQDAGFCLEALWQFPSLISGSLLTARPTVLQLLTLSLSVGCLPPSRHFHYRVTLTHRSAKNKFPLLFPGKHTVVYAHVNGPIPVSTPHQTGYVESTLCFQTNRHRTEAAFVLLVHGTSLFLHLVLGVVPPDGHCKQKKIS